VFFLRVVLYPFGLVTPVPKDIVYCVLPEFTLSTYSIQGFTVPADTVKLLDGVMLFEMFDIVREFHVSVCHAKSAYFISHAVPALCHAKLVAFSYHKFCPANGVFEVLTLCGFNLVTIVFYFRYKLVI